MLIGGHTNHRPDEKCINGDTERIKVSRGYVCIIGLSECKPIFVHTINVNITIARYRPSPTDISSIVFVPTNVCLVAGCGDTDSICNNVANSTDA